MDSRVHEKLQRWHSQIDELEKIEQQCLGLESQEDSLWSALFLNAEGKNVAEKEAVANSHQDWRDFQSGLVAARVAYNRSKRELELRQAAYQAEYLQAKHESEAILRTPRAMT